MIFTKQLVDTAEASAILQRSNAVRSLWADKVARYADIMRSRRWVLNGIPIILSNEGELLDGRHRLLAVVESGMAIPTIVARDVPKDVLHAVDQHRRRSFANVMEARGVPQARQVESLMQRLIQYDDGTMGRRAPRAPWSRLERVLRMNPEILELVQRPRRRGDSLLPEPVRLFAAFMGEQTNALANQRMMHALQQPAAYPPGEPGALLREALTTSPSSGKIQNQFARLAALTILALNATLKGDAYPQLSWSYSRTFPRLRGYPPLRGSFSDLEDRTGAPLPAPLGEASLDGPEINIEMVGPAMAREFLSQNTNNRAVLQSHVEALARDMRAGRWMVNPQPLCFAGTGRLLNGQHRLLAIIKADVGVEMAIIRHLPEEAFDTYDRERPAGTAAAELVPGFGDGALVAAMANLLIKFEADGARPRSAKATATEIREVLREHPRLIELRTFARQAVEYGRASVMGYGAYVIEREDPARGPRFVAALLGGAESLAPLRRRMLRLRRTSASPAEQLTVFIEGWRQISQRRRAR